MNYCCLFALSLEIPTFSFDRLRLKILLKCVPHVQHDYRLFFIIQPITSLFSDRTRTAAKCNVRKGKITCKACKTAVFHRQICKICGCCPSGCISSLQRGKVCENITSKYPELQKPKFSSFEISKRTKDES